MIFAMNNNTNFASRRKWLQYTGASAASLLLGGCATDFSHRRPAYRASPRPLSPQPFARADIRADNIIRTKVGIRPYRPSGFVVRGERMGEKVVIHNYGHGGAGVTLSWGSSTLAVAELPDIADKRAAVLGGGIMGLTTARLLQSRGWQVTIYAKAFSPDTTSDIAGGQWAPTSVFRRDMLTPEFDAQLDQALKISFSTFSQLADGVLGASHGIFWRENYHLSERAFDDERPFYLDRWPLLFPGMSVLRAEDNPFASPHVLRYMTMLIEPAIYMPRLMRDIRAAGGNIVTREFDSLSDVLSLSEPVIFNCTGLGAAKLFGDSELMPVRGQLVFAPPDPRVDYITHGGDPNSMSRMGQIMYMFPRQDGILLGGTFERGATHLTADDATTVRIVAGHQRMFAGMSLG
jgi:D-amino-acid oxidase